MTARLVTLTATADSIDPDARTIGGVIVTYGVAAPSTPPSIFEPGSIRWDADALRRVKLLVDHDASQPVGYAVDLTETDDGRVTGRFYVPETPEGDRALAQARNGLRDGFSVGVWADEDGYTLSDDGLLSIRTGALREVSLCALPAQDDARVAASTVTPTTQPAADGRTMEGHNRMIPETQDTPQAPEPTPQAPAPVQAAATAPVPQAPPVAPHNAGRVTVRQAAQIVSRVIREGGSAQDVRAALADVTPESLPGGTGNADMENPFLRDQYLGELWTATQTERPLIDLLGSPQPVTGLKVHGYTWEVRPQVAAYAGNKADVPTNEPKIVPVEAAVERTAGGWDVDRIFVDLGDASLIESLWRLAVEDYRAKTEAKVATALVGAATSAGDHASLSAALTAVGQAAAGIGANVRGLALAGDVWATFANLPASEVPWWLGSGDSVSLGTASGTVGGTRVFVEPGLAAGSFLAVDPRAATFYESNPPVRVNAIDLPRGGVDLGLFGYHGLIVNDARALIKGTVTPVTETEPEA